jgi:hypothetical protein
MGRKKSAQCRESCEQCQKKNLYLQSERPQGRDQPVLIHLSFRSSSSDTRKKWCEMCYKANLALCELDEIIFTHQCASAVDYRNRISTEISMFDIDSDSHFTVSNVESLNNAIYALQKHLRGCHECKYQIPSSESCKFFILIFPVSSSSGVK